MLKENLECPHRSLIKPSFSEIKASNSTTKLFNCTVLVVENGVRTHDIISQFLCSAGYQVVIVKKGDRTHQNLNESNAIDLIIFNLILPEPSGIKICQLLRSHGSRGEHLNCAISTIVRCNRTRTQSE